MPELGDLTAAAVLAAVLTLLLTGKLVTGLAYDRETKRADALDVRLDTAVAALDKLATNVEALTRHTVPHRDAP